MRILLAGHISYNLMMPYYRALKSNLEHSHIGVLGLNRPGSSVTNEQKESFDEVIEMPDWTKKDLLSILSTLDFWRAILVHFFVDKNAFKLDSYIHLFKTITIVARKVLDQRFLKDKIGEYEMVNFQYIDWTSIKFLPYLQKKHKVILTFWGSDLMQTSGLDIYEQQLTLIERADSIVLHSLEMQEIFLSKYGRQFKAKIRLNYLGLANTKFDLLDQVRENKELLSSFVNQWNIPTDKIKVLIGYSAAVGTQHLEVIDRLNALEESKIHLLLPMTYGTNDKMYVKAVEDKLVASRHSYTCFTKYLTDEAVACLYETADICINVRDSDAFNAAMIEWLYLGKITIVGSWLPYGLMRRNNIDYLEVASIADLTETLENCLEEENTNENYTQNKEKIYQLTCQDYTIKKWCTIYNELYDS